MDPKQLVIKRFEGLSARELCDAPVYALAGVSEADAEALSHHLGIQTIRDLADNVFVSRARALVAASGEHREHVVGEQPSAAPSEGPKPEPGDWMPGYARCSRSPENSQAPDTELLRASRGCAEQHPAILDDGRPYHDRGDHPT